MPNVFIPTMLLPVSNGVKQVRVEGRNVRQIINALNDLYPGMSDRLTDGDELKSNLAVSIDGELARLGMLEKVSDMSEIHFVPAIAGGNNRLTGITKDI
ncbi:MAG: molybdopterin synthase sulfur carrier subunit [Dehalococcoidia bacterium]|nr:molybdopterin synthase sulfur carrier subunit [Dehalococcoidia bacterium]